MSGSVSSPPKKIVFAPVTSAEADEAATHSPGGLGVIVPMLLGVVVIAGALTYLLLGREPAPEIEVLDLSAAFSCPPGSAASTDQMRVTATTLNVRAAPSAGADRLGDRTLRKRATVREECRAGDWSRVRLDDGRSGWVANQYLSPVVLKN